jgi:predicted dehydrogenase
VTDLGQHALEQTSEATKFRTIVVGAGNVCSRWVTGLRARRDVEIVCVVDLDCTRAAALVRDHKLSCAISTTADHAITEYDANLVINLTPPREHAAVSRAALERGCNVLSEKPLAATLVEAYDLLAAVEATGRTLAVMQNRRWTPGVRALRDAVESGAVGEPVFVCADMFQAPHFRQTFFREMPSPLLVDMAIHTFDQARFLTGLEPVSVSCHEFNPSHSWFAGAAAAVCTFEFERSAVFSYRGSWVADGLSTSYDAAWRIVGTGGTAVWDSVGNPVSETAQRPTEWQFAHPVTRVEWPATACRPDAPHRDAIDAMLGAIAAGVVPPTDCTDNIKSLAMVTAALESAATARTVCLADVHNAASTAFA